MCEEEKQRTVAKIVAFLTRIGLSVEYTLLDDKPLFPGITLEQGKLYIDRGKLFYPGELLYKAGKIAVAPPEDRVQLTGNNVPESYDEMMVIAWCWAAMKHLELAPEVLFYTCSFNSSPDDIIEKFNAGRFFGVPLLQWAGMTNEPTKNLNGNMVVFPAMIKWIRD